MLDLLKRFKKNENRYDIGLILKEEHATALLLSVDSTSKSVRVRDRREFKYSNSWENIVEDVDEALFTLEKENKVQVNKSILFVYSHLVDLSSKSIRQPYLGKIKTLLKELDLEPLGYMEHHEALASYLPREEHSSLSAILVEVDDPSISIFIYRKDELIFSDSISKTRNITSDIEEVLKKASKIDVLPQRIILYGSNSLEDESTKIIANKWGEGLFVQIPRIEILRAERVEQALIESFQNQLFGAVSNEKIEKKSFAGPTNVSGDSLDFVVGEDIAEIKEEAPKSIEKGNGGTAFGESKLEPPIIPSSSLAKFKKKISNFKSFIPAITLSNRFSYLILILGLLLVLGSVFILLYYFHNATVTLLYKTEPIDKEITLSDEITFAQKQKKVSVSESIATTGQKYVGNKSKGEITIFNGEAKNINLKKGTKLILNGGIRYILSSDVDVASASSKVTTDGNLLTITGKKTANIEASEIGPEFNLVKDKKLEIEEFSSSVTFAKTSTKITGGTKKEVRTASKADLEKLRKLADNKIKSKSKFSEKNDNVRIIPSLTEIKITSETFSKEISEEADSISVNIKANATFYTYKEDELKKTLQQILTGDLSDDLEITEKSISYEIKKAVKDDKKTRVKFYVKASPRHKIDKLEVSSSIRGKDVNSLGSLLEKKYKVPAYKTDVRGDIPILRTRIPIFTKNIKIEIKSL